MHIYNVCHSILDETLLKTINANTTLTLYCWNLKKWSVDSTVWSNKVNTKLEAKSMFIGKRFSSALSSSLIHIFGCWYSRRIVRKSQRKLQFINDDTEVVCIVCYWAYISILFCHFWSRKRNENLCMVSFLTLRAKQSKLAKKKIRKSQNTLI